MKKTADDEPLQVNCSIEQPLKGIFLETMKREGRTMAGLCRFILVQYFAERMVAQNSNHQTPAGGFYHYPDEPSEPATKQKEAN